MLVVEEEEEKKRVVEILEKPLRGKENNKRKFITKKPQNPQHWVPVTKAGQKFNFPGKMPSKNSILEQN